MILNIILGSTEIVIIKTCLMDRFEIILVCLLGLIIAIQTNFSFNFLTFQLPLLIVEFTVSIFV